jgi:hypothetical protein
LGANIARAAERAIGGDALALFASNQGRSAAAFMADYLPGQGRRKVDSGSLPPSVGDGSFFVSVTSDARDNARTHLCSPNRTINQTIEKCHNQQHLQLLSSFFRKPVNPISQMISKIHAR